jgi:hypothetical protein
MIGFYVVVDFSVWIIGGKKQKTEKGSESDDVSTLVEKPSCLEGKWIEN